jgi:hypothetical protein
MILLNNLEPSLLSLPNFPASAVIGTAAATLDISSVIRIPQTTAGVVLTLPSPTNPLGARLQALINTGTVAFTAYGVSIAPGSYGLFVWNGTTWCAVSAGGTYSSVNLRRNITSVGAGAYVALQTDDLIEKAGGTGVTLPDPTLTPIGKCITIKRTPGTSGNIPISATAAQVETLGNAMAASFNLTTQSYTAVNNGTAWRKAND